MDITAMLRILASQDGSDLYLSTGAPPCAKFNGVLRALNKDVMAPGDVAKIAHELMDAEQRADFERELEMNLAISLPNVGRFRVNIFKQRNEVSIVARNIKLDIPRFEDLKLPPVLLDVILEKRGLVLFVGGTGSGKSTSLAALIDHRNRNHSGHIITIEDPVEYQIHPRMSIVSQREIGTDVPNYAAALKYAVRQDPDVIFIGELRDHDTVLAAVQAAETGHLVFGSLHTADTMQCFSRIVEFFPQHEHGFIRAALSASLKAVCAQRLLPANQDVAGVGVVPATEVLINNAVVRERIREGADSDLPAVINSSLQDGMRSFTHSLAELVEQELVSLNTALEFSSNREALKSRLKGVEVKQGKLVGRLKG